MGTPDFAAKSLERLYLDGHDICGVFTQPDRPKNRGMKLVMSPVKELALSRGTPVFQPTSLKAEAIDALSGLAPDLAVVVAYGKLLPRELLKIPAHGCINIHASILPKYRGAAPIQWAVLNGEKTTGVTSMYLSEGMDTGDIISVKTTDIFENETAGELYERLGDLGAELLSETIFAIADGSAGRTPQDNADATYAPPLTKEMSPIDWNKTASEILCQIHGLNPWPMATMELGGVVLKIYSAVGAYAGVSAAVGTVLSADKEGLKIACKEGSVLITELQPPGGKRMAASDYLRGHPICL